MTSLTRRQPAVKRSASADAFSALVVQVMGLASALEVAGDALARPAGQSSARWQVLAAVEDAPRSVAEAARALSHTRQSVQRVADRLVADGLARYEDNPAHRRAKLLALTPAGRRTLRVIQAAQAEWAEAVARDLDPAALDAARATLAVVATSLRAS